MALYKFAKAKRISISKLALQRRKKEANDFHNVGFCHNYRPERKIKVST